MKASRPRLSAMGQVRANYSLLRRFRFEIQDGLG
jgi:hypothetical protein